MSKKIDWIPNADLPVGKGATRQEYDAKVGADQLVIEKERGGVEAYDGRPIKPVDDGNASDKHLARSFPNTPRPMRGKD